MTKDDMRPRARLAYTEAPGNSHVTTFESRRGRVVRERARDRVPRYSQAAVRRDARKWRG